MVLTRYVESRLTTHDLDIPFGSIVDQSNGNTTLTRRLRVLLLSPSAVADKQLIDTVTRINHFASLTGGQDLAIVFLLNPPSDARFVSARQQTMSGGDQRAEVDGVYAYSKLQAEMINHAEIPHAPILPLAKLDGLSVLLRKHVANLSRIQPKQHASATQLDLLQLCTASPPMSQQTAYILSDLFPSLRDLATACTSVTSAPNSSSPSARAASSQTNDFYDLGLSMGPQSSDSTANNKLKRLRDLVGDQECRDVVDFWKEEFVLE